MHRSGSQKSNAADVRPFTDNPSRHRKPPERKKDMNPLQIPSADLAYLGDAVIELLVREHLIKEGHSGAGRLNAMAKNYVTAAAQADAAAKILPLLDEEEAGVYRRGRNQSRPSVPPSSTASQYRAATAFEALFAYLWLKGDRSRADELLAAAYASDGAYDGSSE